MSRQDLVRVMVATTISIWVLGFVQGNRNPDFFWRRGDAVPAPPAVGACESVVLGHGYPCEEFQVKTADGYILSMQRISHGRVGGDGGGSAAGGKVRQPVLLQHGVLMKARYLSKKDKANEVIRAYLGCMKTSLSALGDSNYITKDGMTWVLNPPDQALAFVLADSGFDVWIANTRGTRRSRAHATLDASDPAYWAWSWDELVDYDLPATFDFVFNQTSQKLDYVGHSLGTLIALASFSEGKLVDKLKSAALLSPIAYLSHMTTRIGQLAAKAFVGEVIKSLGISEFNPKGRDVTNFLKGLCANPVVDCYDLVSSITGKNCCLNESTFDFFLEFEPQSTSTKNMVHLAQTVRDGVIAKYDYGRKDMNIRYYGQDKPPIYNMSNIPRDVPLFLSYGGQDALSDARDVELLLDCLKFHDGDKLTVQYIEDYAHADFIIGVSAKRLVYDAIITFFNRQH